MIVTQKETAVSFMPKDEVEEKLLDRLKVFFNDNDYRSDRVWNKKQSKDKTPLGIRVYFG